MLRIERIKLKNFKSFRSAELEFPASFICFMGPNGSGKSNICDAIRFALGEMSMKALRVHSFRQLIHHDAKHASVTVVMQADGKRYEIKRSIGADGKMEYRLNGKKTTRASILELLRQHNVDESGRNIIGQGELERIVTLSPKERRAIIDSVAGIADFEEKKKEALKNLDIVESRIRETAVLLGEKLSTLERLEKEKAEAERYLRYKQELKNAKGTLLKRKLSEVEQKLHLLTNEKERLEKEKEELVKGLEEVENTIAELSACSERDEEVKARKALEELEENINQLLATKERLIAKLEEKKKHLVHLEERAEKLAKKLGELEKAEEQLKLEREQWAEELSNLPSLPKELEKQSEEIKAKLDMLIEEKARVEHAIERIKGKLEGLKTNLPEVDENAIKRLEAEIQGLSSRLMELFEKEKQFNREIAETDRALINARERLGWLRAQAPRLGMSKVLEYIESLKSEIPGIHGPLIDLISFSDEYAKAIESAAGGKLLYVVVDNADIAIQVIKRLKEAKIGRATFIPLAEIKAGQYVPKGLIPLSSLVKYDPIYEKAVQFALGDTALVKDAEEAKKVGIGICRMVTLEGELFEVSGVISGGTLKTGVAIAAALAKVEQEVEELKKQKESLLEELQSIRQKMSELRAERAKKEVELKTLKQALSEGKREEMKKLEDQLAQLILQANELEKEEMELRELLERATKAEKAKEEELKQLMGETIARASALRERLVYSEKKLQELERERNAFLEELQSTENEISKTKEELAENARVLESVLLELEQLVGKKSMVEKELEAYGERAREIGEKLTALGKKKAELSRRLDQVKDSLRSVEIAFASEHTKEQDLKAELEELGDFELIEEEESLLVEKIEEAKTFLEEHQQVNLAAIELYDEKKKEVGDVKEKIDKLREEKEGILRLIAEIERKKERAFFNTFYKVAEAFKEMYKKTGLEGEGYLSLDKPSKVFESGLYIKVRREGKEIDLLSLSGGEKALLALAFIFALEVGRPSPFYILDEIDSALDPNNSKQIGMFIRKLAERAQFLVVSHREQMVSCAELVFGVSRQGNASILVGIRLP